MELRCAAAAAAVSRGWLAAHPAWPVGQQLPSRRRLGIGWALKAAFALATPLPGSGEHVCVLRSRTQANSRTEPPSPPELGSVSSSSPVSSVVFLTAAFFFFFADRD